MLDRLRDDGIEEINFFKLLAPPELHRPEDDEAGRGCLYTAMNLDLVVRIFLGILVDDQILGGEVGILLLDHHLLLGRVERQRLLGLEDRLGIPGDPQAMQVTGSSLPRS